MKQTKLLAVWGAVTALSFAALTTPAADQDRTTNSDSQFRSSTTTEKSDKTLGQVERANKLIGHSIYGSDNQKLGRLDNLIVDLESGRVLYAVLSTGPLGIGGHDYALPP